MTFDLPERRCRHCGSIDVTWSENRPLKRMIVKDDSDHPTHGSCDCRRAEQTVDVYSCETCGRRFVDRPGFEGLHYAANVVLFGLRLVARDMVPNDAATTIREEKGVKVSGRTIQRWVDKYPDIILTFSKNMENDCNAASFDEKHYKSKGESRWMARASCVKSRFILESEHWSDKLNHDATTLFQKVKKRLGRPPLMVISDKLKGYKTVCEVVMNAESRMTTFHAANASINGVHINNNIHERQNGETERHKKGSRGFNSDNPGRFTLEEVYHNFLRPHMGLGGMTPAEKAGIHIPGHDKLLTLIRCAVAARFNFA